MPWKLIRYLNKMSKQFIHGFPTIRWSGSSDFLVYFATLESHSQKSKILTSLCYNLFKKRHKCLDVDSISKTYCTKCSLCTSSFQRYCLLRKEKPTSQNFKNAGPLSLSTYTHLLLCSSAVSCSIKGMRFYGSSAISSTEGTNNASDLNSFTTSSEVAIENISESNYNEPIDDDIHSSDLQKQTVSDVSKRSLSELSGSTYNLAPFVERSATLQNLIRMGVDLSRIEKISGMANHVLMSDFDKDILPYLRHLANVGVEPDKLGSIISANPRFLKVSIPDLETQVGYLLSKKFSLQDIASMYSRGPIMLLMDPGKLDAKLGFLQKTFKLSGHDIRSIALTFPKLLSWKQEKIAAVRFTMKEFLGFSDNELRQMIIKDPKLFTANNYSLKKTFDYVNNTMLVPHKQIVLWPDILHSRHHLIKSRHLFLLYIERAQYDPCKENYVSMKALVSYNDEQFCQDVAKSNTKEYYSFLKTL